MTWPHWHLNWMSLKWMELSVHYRILNISDLYPQDADSNIPPSCDNQKYPGCYQMSPPQTKLQAVLEHRTRKSNLSWESCSLGSVVALGYSLTVDWERGRGLRKGMSCLRFLSVGSLYVLCVGSPLGQRSPATLWAISCLLCRQYTDALWLFCWSHTTYSGTEAWSFVVMAIFSESLGSVFLKRVNLMRCSPERRQPQQV